MINKQDFLNAFMYCYGSTKKEALKRWKEASDIYKQAIIDSLKQDAKKAFYND